MQITLNGDPRTVQPGSTVGQLLQELDMADKRVAVEINREIVPRSQHAEHILQPGDSIEIVVAVGGG